MAAQESTQTYDVLIVGAGFAGLYSLFKVRGMGLTARVLEAADGIGGTWYHNRYPGARVDIQSLEYSYQFSEALQQEWKWTERYAAQPELLRYANHVADRFGLRDGIQLSTRVTRALFDEAANVWRVHAHGNAQAGTDKAQTLSARFLVMASGPLSSPNTPAFKGLETFAGSVYHTARWPKEPVDLCGKRVGVIGTGSSGVQAIPILAQQAQELTVFQRTACYSIPAHNGPIDPAFEARIKADYAGFRARSKLSFGGFGSELPRNPMSAIVATPEQREAAFEERWRVGGFSFLGAFDDLLMHPRSSEHAAEFVRNKIRSIVRNPQTAELLCPKQTIGCKRLCVDSGYYDTFNRKNVKLVDVSEHPIEEITAHGLRTNGSVHELDVLVLATGFDAMTGALTRIDVRGRGGVSLKEKWQDGPLNYLGLTVAGFPNLFHIGGPGSPSVLTCFMLTIEHHVDWIADCIGYLDAQGLKTVEATAQAEAQWVKHVNAVARGTIFMSCNSWYLGANIAGKPRMFMPLISGFPVYAERCAQVARDGYEGFALG